MKEQLESKKDMNDFKIVIPMSDETIKKIKSNAAKAVLGASIAGVMIAGGQSVKAQSIQEPAAVVQTIDAQNENDKKELSLMIDEILTSKEKKTDAAEIKVTKNINEVNEAPAETLSITNTSSDETQVEAEAQAQELNAAKEQTEDTTQADEAGQAEEKTEEKTTLSLDDFINNEGIETLFDADKIKADAAKNLDVDNLDLEEEKTPEVQKAGEDQKATEPNYAEDEKKIKDYSEEERYRSSQMEQGNGTAADYIPPDEMDNFIDGYRYHSSEPSATSEDKTQWGVEIEIDKEKGQRTYTDFYFTNSGNLGGVLDTGNVSANEAGEKIAGGEENPNYKAKSDIKIDGKRAQRNLNLVATEEDLKHINKKDNNDTIMAWQGKYLKDNPNGLKATEGPNALFSFTVNPWPNENDKLELIKLNGKHDKKEFVQGQTIETGVSVENLDDNARERLVGQVYHPLTGEVVPGAKAYINDQGKVVVEMPKGTINEDGSINEDSIFYKDSKYKGIQNLEVKFFARPRTADEFRAIVEGNEAGFYTGAGAGTKKIKHDGKEVEVDLQGIDRYDHYNLIGGFKLNLDDTRYYDQDFKDKNQDDTSKHTHSKVKPGEEFDVNLYVPTDKTDKDAFPNQKTPKEMEDAKDANQAIGSIDTSFIDKINEGKAEEDKWVLDYDKDTLPTTLKVTPPKSAKAGDFVAVPLTYTYTNGSTDVHWFHFVVQESTNVKPEYDVQVDYPTAEQTSPADVKPDGKKLEPKSYSIPEGTEFKDDKGNEWTVTIDEKTGQVTAKPNNPKDFKGGEKLQVPVISHYEDPNEPGKVITEETKAEFVIKEKTNTAPDYSAKVGKAGEELTSSAKTNKDEDEYNRLPDSYKFPDTVKTDDEGNRYVKDENNYKWIVTIDPKTGEVKATVPYGQDVNYAKLRGTIVNVPVEAHYVNENGDDAGTEETSVQFVATGDDFKNIQYDAQKGKAGDTLNSEVILDQNEYERKPVKYTIDKTEYEDEKGNKWTVSIDEKTGKVTATVPKAAAGKTIDLDGTMITVPVTAHYEDASGNLIGKKEANVQFLGSGTQGTHQYKEKIPFETKVEVVKDLAPGEWRYKKIDGVEQKGVNGSETKEITIKDSKVEGDPKTIEKVDPVNAIIEIGNADYTGTVTHEEKIETPFEVEYEYSTELEAGQSQIKQKGEKGSYDLVYSQKIKNGEADGKATTSKDNVKEAKKEIIVIGIKPVENVVEKPFDTIYEYDENMDAGKTEEVTPGVNGKTTTTTSYDQKENKLVSNEESTDPTNRVVKIGIKPVTKEVETDYKTKIIYDDQLEAGKVVETEGEKGKTTITTSYDKDKNELVTKEKKTDPKDKVVRIGIKSVEKEVETDYKTKIEYDPNLEAGKVEKTEGEKGKTKITTSYDKDKNELVTAEKVEKEPKDEVIKIGTKKPQPVENTTSVSKEVGTKIEYIYDDDLELGNVILGDFTPGKVETKVVQKYDQATGKITATEQTTVTPGVQKIVVGTKKTENTCPAPDPDKPNPDKPSTEDPEQPGGGEEPGKPGGEEPGKPGGEEPGKPGGEEPGKPGEEEPGTPGEKDPEKPGTPGTPDTPDTPSEGGTTNTEEKPNEDPKDSETKPETSVEKDKDLELNEETPVEKTEEAVENPELEKQNEANKTKQLPKTGDGMNRSFYGYTMGLIGSALLALGAKKKKNDTVDEK